MCGVGRRGQNWSKFPLFCNTNQQVMPEPGDFGMFIGCYTEVSVFLKEMGLQTIFRAIVGKYGTDRIKTFNLKMLQPLSLRNI